MGTAAVWNPTALEEVGEVDRVVAALDIRAGRARGAGWLDEGRSVTETLAGLAEAGVVRLLVTGIERDGAMRGPDLDLLAEVSALSGMAVIASGGVGNLSDLAAVAALRVRGGDSGDGPSMKADSRCPRQSPRPVSCPIAGGALRTATPPPPSRH